MRLPSQLITVVGEIMAQSETHDSMNNLFMSNDVPFDPPVGNKRDKAKTWLRLISNDENLDTLEFLGRLIEGYMEPPILPATRWETKVEMNASQKIRIDTIETGLKRANLQYFQGGRVSSLSGSPTKSLRLYIEKLDFAAIEHEFDRAIKNIGENPRESVSAACNILESVFKVYIESNEIKMPKKMDIQPLWKIVRDDLGFDPSKIEDRDLKEILSGLASITGGIGSLRSHASSAHGAGNQSYKLEPRHARLAIHSAHTLAIFVLESWEKRK